MSEKVKMTLVGVDGNAFVVMGTFKKFASRQGWSETEITKVLDEARSGDYNHLLATILDNITDPEPTVNDMLKLYNLNMNQTLSWTDSEDQTIWGTLVDIKAEPTGEGHYVILKNDKDGLDEVPMGLLNYDDSLDENDDVEVNENND